MRDLSGPASPPCAQQDGVEVDGVQPVHQDDRVLGPEVDSHRGLRAHGTSVRRVQTGCLMRVRLIRTTDPHTRLTPGAEGTVVQVDQTGTVRVRWDNGSALGLIPGRDRFDCLCTLCGNVLAPGSCDTTDVSADADMPMCGARLLYGDSLVGPVDKVDTTPTGDGWQAASVGATGRALGIEECKRDHDRPDPPEPQRICPPEPRHQRPAHSHERDPEAAQQEPASPAVPLSPSAHASSMEGGQ